MARLYGYWTTGQLQAEVELRDRQIAEKQAEQEEHDELTPTEVSLAHSHLALLLSREALALSQDRLELYYEVEFRARGDRHQLQ